MSLPAEIPEISGQAEYLRSMFIHGTKHVLCSFTSGG